MAQYRFIQLDVFTEEPFTGNALAVFPEAEGLNDEQMQRIAREMNLSETVFVLPSAHEGVLRRLRIFTPTRELPFAGHPTIGTAAVLASRGLVGQRVILEEGVGPIAVEVRLDGSVPYARLTREGEVAKPATRPSRPAAAAISLTERDVLDTWFASVGVPFAFVHLASAEVVDRAVLERAAWTANFSRAWAPNLYLFAGEPVPGSRLYVRMFGPAFGIEEDPATGSGAAALAGCLADRLASDGTFAWQIDQGVCMGRPSRLETWAERRGGRTVAVKVGGSTVLVGEGTMTVPAGL